MNDPSGATRHRVAPVGDVGLTVSLFITGLASTGVGIQSDAKIGAPLASVIAAGTRATILAVT